MVKRSLYAVFFVVLIAALMPPASGLATSKANLKRFSVRPLDVKNVRSTAKSPSARLARTDRSLLGRKSSKPINVMVKLDYDAAAAYAGGVQGLRATSPEATRRPLARNTSALSAYLGYAKNVERAVVNRISAQVPSARVTGHFRIAYGGLALRLPANQVGKLLAVDGVVSVQRNRLSQPQTDTTPRFIGATQAWQEIQGSKISGEGVIVGVLDTGIWPEHPSLIDPGVDHPGGTYGCEFGNGSDPLLGDPFACNDKLIGAYAFLDTYMTFIGAEEGEFCNNATDVCSPRDANGHGTHTATTAAGARVEDVDIFDIPKPRISGMAPGAHVIAYRVCLAQGCFQSDTVEAVEQAIVDDVDVINFSISGGANAYADAVELAFLDAYAGGTLVNASAGNAGPGAGTADHAGPWTNTVGASTSNRHWLSTLRLNADNGDRLRATGSTITPGIGTATEVVDGGTCATPLPAGSVTGKIVLCEAFSGRNVRVHNVMQGGGAGVILFNRAAPNEMFTDNFWLPTIMLQAGETSEDMLDFFNSHTGVVARWATGVASRVRGDRMTKFSSRGPSGDFIKPDVTAPGMQILAGTTPDPAPVEIASGPPGELFQSIAGTSMSSPHSAGVSALVKAAHPNWSPGQIKSALMTSSVQNVVKEDGVTPADPFDRGAGSIRAHLAINPTVTFDVGAGKYLASAADPLHRIDLNLPSINAPVMSGQVSTERTMKNVSGKRQVFTVQTIEPAGADFVVEPSTFEMARRAKKTIDITINGESLDDGQYFGQIKLVAQGASNTDAVIPVAFVKSQGDISLTHDCSPDSIPNGDTSSCTVEATNFSASPANVDIEVEGPDGVEISNPSVPTQDLENGFRWSGTLEGAVAPTIDAITPGGAPSPYLPLGDFGVPPIGGVGDETIVNFDVPTYLYGSEAYDVIAMTSNGYAVVGGGDSNDLDFVPQTLPDPARPNNTLAAFWTDLNPGAGGNLYAAILGEDPPGTREWLVLEWAEVPTFTDGLTNSFQIWVELETSPGIEGIHYAYGTMNDPGGDSGIGVTVGAENRDGSSGVMLEGLVASDTEYTIETSPPEPGGSITITYDATGRRRGTYKIPARLTSDITVGTTTDFADLTVTRP